MQDEKERGTELDYCDLDPTKICDNCCKCIDSGKDYEDFQIELTDSISTLDEIMELPFDDDLFDDDDYDDDDDDADFLLSPQERAEIESEREDEAEDAFTRFCDN